MCAALARTDFWNFLLRKGVVILKGPIFTLGACGGLENSDFGHFTLGGCGLE